MTFVDLGMADPEGFEPSISGLEGLRVSVGFRRLTRRLILAWPRVHTDTEVQPLFKN